MHCPRTAGQRLLLLQTARLIVAGPARRTETQMSALCSLDLELPAEIAESSGAAVSALFMK
jgi:hypothetical protein